MKETEVIIFSGGSAEDVYDETNRMTEGTSWKGDNETEYDRMKKDDNDGAACWKISFLSCYKVLYETDADRRKIIKVRDMKKPQLGYFGQDISVCESEEADFYKVNLDLSIMKMQIECKDILVEKTSKEDLELFWTYN